MAFTVHDLLLTSDKQQDLIRALRSIGVSDPLGYCIAEASADVERYTTGYSIDDTSKRAWIRALALRMAYSLAEAIPADVQKLYESAIEELKAIAAGERPNLTKIDDDDEEVAPGTWGSEDKIE